MNKEKIERKELEAFALTLSPAETKKAFEAECARCPFDFDSNPQAKMLAHGFFLAGQNRILRATDTFT